jgi:hypothetical protein
MIGRLGGDLWLAGVYFIERSLCLDKKQIIQQHIKSERSISPQDATHQQMIKSSNQQINYCDPQ